MNNFPLKRDQTEENVLTAIQNSGDFPVLDARELSKRMVAMESVRFALVRRDPPCMRTIPAEYITEELLDAALNSTEVSSQRGAYLRPIALRYVPIEMVTYERLLQAVRQNASVLELGWRFMSSDENGVYSKEAMALALAAAESEYLDVSCVPTGLFAQALRTALAEDRNS